MHTYTLKYFEDDAGCVPFVEWLTHMKDRKGAAIIKARIERLRLGNFGDSKYLRNGVEELRISYGPGYRIYYTITDNTTKYTDIEKSIKYATVKKLRYIFN